MFSSKSPAFTARTPNLSFCLKEYLIGTTLYSCDKVDAYLCLDDGALSIRTTPGVAQSSIEVCPANYFGYMEVCALYLII